MIQEEGDVAAELVGHCCKVLAQLFLKASTKEVAIFYAGCSDHLVHFLEHTFKNGNVVQNNCSILHVY